MRSAILGMLELFVFPHVPESQLTFGQQTRNRLYLRYILGLFEKVSLDSDIGIREKYYLFIVALHWTRFHYCTLIYRRETLSDRSFEPARLDQIVV